MIFIRAESRRRAARYDFNPAVRSVANFHSPIPRSRRADPLAPEASAEPSKIEVSPEIEGYPVERETQLEPCVRKVDMKLRGIQLNQTRSAISL